VTTVLPDPDTALVADARAGESTAITELYRRHEKRVYNLALRTVGNTWDAADVTQEAFIKAFRNLDSFKGEALFSTWLHRIAVNAAYDLLRRHRVEPVDSDILEEVSGPVGAGAFVGSSRGMVDPALDTLSDPMRKALLGLNEGFRLAVVLCDLLGFPYDEAAEILGVQEGTIKSRIFRAREALAVALENEGYAPTSGRNQPKSTGVVTHTVPDED
jgi:RNA polymerase sigma-70 factor, ECF subfamily